MIKITKGKPSNISTNLIIKESIFPPKYPEIAPYERPIVNATKVARNPTSKEILLPYRFLKKDLFQAHLSLEYIDKKEKKLLEINSVQKLHREKLKEQIKL